MSKSKSSRESDRISNNRSTEKKALDPRRHREIVEANLRALKHKRLAFQR